MNGKSVSPKEGEPEASSKSGYFGSEGRSDFFDERARFLAHIMPRQSNREHSRATFDKISTSAKKNAHEEKHVIMEILLVMLADQEALQTANRAATNKWDELVQTTTFLLLIENFFRDDMVRRSHIRRLKITLPCMLQLFKVTIDRKTGVGMDFVKMHLPLHMIHDIERFGPAPGFDSATGEHGHIFFKNAAERSQKNKKTFLTQTATESENRRVIQKAMERIQEEDDRYNVNDRMKEGILGKHYYVNDKGMFMDGNKHRKHYELHPVKIDLTERRQPNKRVEARWADRNLQDRITQLIQEHVLPNVTEERIFLYTVCDRQDKVNPAYWSKFRADPDYKSGIPTKSVWHDWVYVSYETDNKNTVEIPARIMIFVKIVGLKEGRIIQWSTDVHEDEDQVRSQTHSITQDGDYAIVQSLPEELSEEGATKIRKKLRKQMGGSWLSNPLCSLVYFSWVELVDDEFCRHPNSPTFTPVLYVVDVETFARTCIAVPYEMGDDKALSEESHRIIDWLIIRPRTEWNDLLIKMGDELYKNPRYNFEGTKPSQRGENRWENGSFGDRRNGHKVHEPRNRTEKDGPPERSRKRQKR